MGLLDSVLGGALGAITGGGQGGSDAAGGAMLIQVLGGLLSGQGSGGGGLGGLLQQLQRGGLGEAVKSWVSSGHNLPISAEQLQAALGSDQVSAMAQQAGLSQDDLMGKLAQMLPQAVDHLTPNGEVPAEGGQQADLGASLGGVFNSFLKN